MKLLTTCLAPTELQALVDGQILADGLSAEHLENCPSCQRRLKDMVADSGIWRQVRTHLSTGVTNGAVEVERVLARLEAGGPETLPTADTTEPPALDFLEPSDRPGCLGRLAHYDVQEIIGRGGMGVVLKAFDQRLQRSVAIKLLATRNATDRAWFLREARAMAAICSEHVIEVYSVDDGAVPFIVMEYLISRSLQERLDRAGPTGLAETVRIGMETALGLAAAHAEGLVHRDVKPANILVAEETGKVKLTDFGLARAVDDASLNRCGEVAGTPSYMAPEQAGGGAVDHRADLFSLGSVLYALCTGEPPFAGTGGTTVVLREVRMGCLKPVRELNPQVPDWLAALIAKLHALNPADRYGSAAEVAEVLRCRLAELTRPAGLLRRRRWLLGVAAILFVVTGWVTWFVWPRPLPLLSPDPDVVAVIPDPPSLPPGPPRVLFVLPAKDFYYPDHQPVRNALKQAGVIVLVATPAKVVARPMGDDPNHLPVPSDLALAEAKGADYHAIYFPGGEGVEEFATGAHAADARRLIAEARTAKRHIAALGIGPIVLADAGVLKDIRATCWKYGKPPLVYVNRLTRAGAIYVAEDEEPVVVSGSIITAHGPAEARAFSKVLVDQLGIRPP